MALLLRMLAWERVLMLELEDLYLYCSSALKCLYLVDCISQKKTGGSDYCCLVDCDSEALFFKYSFCQLTRDDDEFYHWVQSLESEPTCHTCDQSKILHFQMLAGMLLSLIHI